MDPRAILWRAAGAALGGVVSPAGPRARLSILVYHGVGPADDAIANWEVDAARFDNHMRVLKHAFNVLTLEEAVEHLRSGTLPVRAACITLDDGYANNATIALPILKRHGLPATFFIASAYLDGGRMFNDAITETVRRSVKAELVLDDVGLGRHDLSTDAARARAVAELLSVVRALPPGDRAACTEAIVRASGIEPRSRLMMTREQVAMLVREGMSVGGHTSTHPVLNSVPDDEAMHEIRASKEELEGITGRPVTLFAYPNGLPGRDYSARHVAMVQQAGFRAAVTTAHGAAGHGDDVFQLPRFTPWDRTAERFLARLLLNCRQRDYEVAP